MQEGTFFDRKYIVQYTQRDRAEGGPIVTRYFDSHGEALTFIDRLQSDPEANNPEIWKQETTTKRSRIH